MYRNIIIVILVIVIFLALNSNKDFKPIIVTKTDTLYKTHNVKIYKKGADIYHNILDTIYEIDEYHDTAYIVKDYNEVKAYKDTLKLDQGFVAIYDTISNNAILGRGYYSHLVEKTITIKETIQAKPKNAFYLGFLGDLRQDKTLEGVGIGMVYKVKDKALIGISAHTTKRLGVSLYFKL